MTGTIVDRPGDVVAVAEALEGLLARPDRAAMGRASRTRAETEFAYDLLAARLGDALGCASVVPEVAA